MAQFPFFTLTLLVFSRGRIYLDPSFTSFATEFSCLLFSFDLMEDIGMDPFSLGMLPRVSSFITEVSTLFGNDK